MRQLVVLRTVSSKDIGAFPVVQFSVDGFKMYRNDYTEHAAELMTNFCAKADISQHNVKRNDGKYFSKLIKPLISNKSGNKSNNLIPRKGDGIINDPLNVSNILNEYFVNFTRSIACEQAIFEGESFDDIVN